MSATIGETQNVAIGRQLVPGSPGFRNRSRLKPKAVIAIMVTAFLLGFALSSTSAGASERDPENMLGRASLAFIQLEPASTALGAERGRFDEARLNASSFFRNLRARYELASEILAQEFFRLRTIGPPDAARDSGGRFVRSGHRLH